MVVFELWELYLHKSKGKAEIMVVYYQHPFKMTWRDWWETNWFELRPLSQIPPIWTVPPFKGLADLSRQIKVL